MDRIIASKPRKKLFNRAQIIDSAARMFMEHGYAATSVDMIAKSMGCTKGYIYNYFKSKIEIYFSIHRLAMENATRAISPIFLSEVSFSEKLLRMSHSHIMLIVEETHFSRVSILGLEMHIIEAALPKERAELREITLLRDRYEEMFCEVITRGVETGEFRPCNPKIVVKALLGSLNWTVLWYNPRQRMNRAATRKTVEEVLDYVMLGVVPRSAPSQ